MHLLNVIFMNKSQYHTGGVEQMKKSHSRWGGVAKCENRIPTLGGNQKKNDSHAAWECKNSFVATPLARERRLQKSRKIDSCEIWSILGGAKVRKMNCILKILQMMIKIMIL